MSPPHSHNLGVRQRPEGIYKQISGLPVWLDPPFLGSASSFFRCSSSLKHPRVPQATKRAFSSSPGCPVPRGLGRALHGKPQNASLAPGRSHQSACTWSLSRAFGQFSMRCPEFIHNFCLWDGESITSHSVMTDTETFCVLLCKEVAA